MKSGIALSPVEQKVTPHEGDFRRHQGLCALAAGRRGFQVGGPHTHTHILTGTVRANDMNAHQGCLTFERGYMYKRVGIHTSA